MSQELKKREPFGHFGVSSRESKTQKSACSLPSVGDRSNIIFGVSRSNHKERGKFKDNVIKKNNLDEEEKYFCLVIVNKNNNKN